MNILDKIIAHKIQETATQKARVSASQLENSEHFLRKTFSLKESLLNPLKTGIIAEFKRQSPSKGIINPQAQITDVTQKYTENGASCLSILTDKTFFGGSAGDIQQARIHNIPILRKEFIVDTYQILEAKAMGADAILLIAACLSPEKVADLALFAKHLQLEVLLEIHTEEELNHICDATEIVGVNNRNLKTFEVDIHRSIELSKKIPSDKIKIAESGISNMETLLRLKNEGFQGFLMGETFMKQPDPGLAFASFVQELNSIKIQAINTENYEN